jgi:hypothetical protein
MLVLGAALIVAVLVDRLVDYKKQVAVISMCVALAISMHLTNEKDFAYSWEKQERFAQQLIWRAPQIESGTAWLQMKKFWLYGRLLGRFFIITPINLATSKRHPTGIFHFY